MNEFLIRAEKINNLSGDLTIYTSKKACISCINGYLSFQNKLPNVNLKVITLDENLQTNFRKIK
jgi:DUF4097 and DUF4098 domain-containing protein YvlB